MPKDNSLAATVDVADANVRQPKSVRPNDWCQFVPGPVPIAPFLLEIGTHPLPYNRTEAFSATTHEILDGLKGLFKTAGQVALLTGSGTAAMEAAALNFSGPYDRALIVNGGTFGQRWVDICEALGIWYDELPIQLGDDIDLAQLETLLSDGQYSMLMINAHETSTGHLYDIESIGALTRGNNIFLIVDAISSVCADPFAMDDWGVDVAILSSQKALALPPGLSFIAMSERALKKLDEDRAPPKSLYFDLKNYLANQVRGQLPYTPAIGLMIQLQARLKDIQDQTLDALISRHRQRAESFRNAIQDTVFAILPMRSSNAITALSTGTLDAGKVVAELRDLYQIIIAPNGGALSSKVIRVSHMGEQDQLDINRLVSALGEINAKSNNRKLVK